MELAEAVENNIQEFTAEALSNGEEGAVLKKRDAPYAPDKRPAWSSIKIKKMDFLDCICIGFEDATHYYMDRVIRKKDLGGKYNPLALDGRYDYLNDENEDEDEDSIE